MRLFSKYYSTWNTIACDPNVTSNLTIVGLDVTFGRGHMLRFFCKNICRMACLSVLMASACAGEAPIQWTAPVELAEGEAYRGPWRMNESVYLFVDDPTVAITDQEVVVAAWVDHTQRDVVLQVYDADGNAQFDAPVNVSNSPDVFSWLPRVVTRDDDAREIYVLWQEIVFSGGSHGGETFFARSHDGGETFSTPINLSNTIAGAGKGRLTTHSWHNGSLDLAIDTAGRLYTAWTEYEGALWFSRSDDQGATFTEPLHVAGDDRLPARGPALAVGPDDEVFLAWTVGEDQNADIHFARSTDRGTTFSEPVRLHEGSGHADAPKLALDGNGTLHLVYGESRGGPETRYRIRYTQSQDHGESFSEPVTLSDRIGANFLSLSVDGDGGVYVIWERFPTRSLRSRGLGYAVSRDGGATFSSPDVVPGTDDPALGFNGSQQGLLMRKLAVNSGGEVAVVNSTYLQGENSHIWLIRGTPTPRPD